MTRSTRNAPGLALFAAGLALGLGLAALLIPAAGSPGPQTDARTAGLGVAWLVFGFLAQGLFMGRMVVQWLASERAGRSVIPATFWWLSLTGGLMLLLYFLRRGDPVGVWGQLLGIGVYTRNIILMQRARPPQSGPAPALGGSPVREPG